MLCIAVEFLAGYFVASRPSSRGMPEWPPHPARLFMALVAAHFEAGAERSEVEALKFIETLSPPSLRASGYNERRAVSHFVPVNDELNIKKGGPFPLLRSRQERQFPMVRPDRPTVYFIWPDANPPQEIVAALAQLCGKMTRLGHSSSLVSAWVSEPPNDCLLQDMDCWTPTDQPEDRLRCATPGLFEELQSLYRTEATAQYIELTLQAAVKGKRGREAKAKLGKEFPGGMPQPARPRVEFTAGYARNFSGTPVGHTVWDEVLAYRLHPVEGTAPLLDICAAPALVGGMRRAIMAAAGDFGPLPEVISGHSAGSAQPSENPHCAIFAMPFVGYPYADGRIMGVGLAVPRACNPGDFAVLRSAMGRLCGANGGLRLGRLGRWSLSPSLEFPAIAAIQPRRWTGMGADAESWATVTPIAFDAHPKAKDSKAAGEEIAAMIVAACNRIGLPSPDHVEISHVSFVSSGAPTAYEFPRLARKDGSLRRQAHARITFPHPVVGPVLLGAGRYRGYGLMAPQRKEPAGG